MTIQASKSKVLKFLGIQPKTVHVNKIAVIFTYRESVRILKKVARIDLLKSIRDH